MLPFEPQTIEELKAKYENAIILLYDVDNLKKWNKLKRPGRLYSNIFDFEDGLRLIISKDKMNKIVYIHFSASLILDTLITGPIKTKEDFENEAIKRFREISGNKNEIDYYYVSEAHIPHWGIKYENN